MLDLKSKYVLQYLCAFASSFCRPRLFGYVLVSIEYVLGIHIGEEQSIIMSSNWKDIYTCTFGRKT